MSNFLKAYISGTADTIYFRPGMCSLPICQHLHSKFGVVWSRDHGAINMHKIVNFVLHVNILKLCTHATFSWPHDTLPCFHHVVRARPIFWGRTTLSYVLIKQSALLTTFITPCGRYCFNHLPFRITSAPEHFQRRMSYVLQGLEGVVCLIDDILVHGKTQEEHDKHLTIVLQKLLQQELHSIQPKVNSPAKKSDSWDKW